MVIKFTGPAKFTTVEDGAITLHPGEWAEVEQLDGKFRRVTARGGSSRGIHPDASGRAVAFRWCRDCRKPCDTPKAPLCSVTGRSCVQREPMTI
jgi:hypothetical protein